jgi:serine/threonine protein kinase
MANELLNDGERLPSADMFSLGLTLYELCCYYPESCVSAAASPQELRFTPAKDLPFRDDLWHTLREDRAPPVPASRCAALQRVVTECMRSDASMRPTASQLLTVPEVTATLDDVDPVLLCAPRHADALSRSGVPILARSASLQAIEARQLPPVSSRGLGGGIAGTSNVPSTAGSLSIQVGSDEQIDYAALGDGAFTPNFSHSAYDANHSPR